MSEHFQRVSGGTWTSIARTCFVERMSPEKAIDQQQAFPDFN